MFSKRKWFADSIVFSRRLIVRQWVPLLLLVALSCALNIGSEDAMQLMTGKDDSDRWILQLAMALWDLFEGVLLILILSWGVPKIRSLALATLEAEPFRDAYIASFLAEYLRVLAQVLMWGLLLLVPGLVRYCQLIFVPLITIFSKDYRAGKVDALKLSEQLVLGRLLLIFMAVGIPMVLELGVEFLPQLVPDLHILPVRLLFAVVEFLLSVWTFALIYLLFEHAMEGLRIEETR
jgi:hypothetical protein